MQDYDVVLRLLDDGAMLLRAHFGPMLTPPSKISFNAAEYRCVSEHGTLHVPDVHARRADFPTLGSMTRFRTFLAAPLRQNGEFIGSLNARRTEVRGFTAAQIKLLESFADQAVIALENVRLFKELQLRNRELTEALEQQTATGEVLRVIASSPTELEPVLDTLITNAVKLSGATKGHVCQVDGEFYRVVAHYGESPERISFLRDNPLPASADTPTSRALLGRKPVHIADLQLEPEPLASFVRQTGVRSLLATPLIREGMPIGAIIIWRDVVEPFTERQIELVKTFADQAVIAMENVRLFQELQARNRDLMEALEQQTATSEILRVIASSPTDIQPVLDTVAENAARVCEATDAVITRADGESVKQVAQFGAIPVPKPNRINRHSPVSRAIVDKKTIHVHDLLAQIETAYPESKERQKVTGTRTILVTPLLREGVPIGTINIRRTEVRPFSEKHVSFSKLLPTRP